MAEEVDYFGDGDLSEYFGSTGNFDVSNGVLSTDVANAGNYRIVSTSGLPNYPNAGDVYACEMRAGPDSNTEGNPEMLFAATDTDNWYSVAFGYSRQEALYQVADGDGRSPGELGNESFSWNLGEWYDVRVKFGGDITSDFVFEEGDGITVGDAGDTDLANVEGVGVEDSSSASGFVREEGNPLAEPQSESLEASVYDSPSSDTPLVTITTDPGKLVEAGIGFRNAAAGTANEQWRNARIL